MDEITRHLKLARAHYNDSPVLNQLYLTWSRRYRADLYQDTLANAIRRGRQIDSRIIVQAGMGHEARRRAWRYMLFHSIAIT